jgi:hypothetical protein
VRDGKVAIRVDDIFELAFLSHSWEVLRATSELVAIISDLKYSNFLLLPSISYCQSQQEPILAEEIMLKTHFFGIIENSRLLSFGVEFLNRVIPDSASVSVLISTGDEIDSLFNFLICCLDQFGIWASILFSHLVLNRLQHRDLRHYFDRRDFCWSFVESGIYDVVDDLICSEIRRDSLFVVLNQNFRRNSLA